MRSVLALILTLCAAPAGAHAGLFGGFSADETRYLEGRDRICRPIPAGLRTAAPSCSKAKTADVAAGAFRKPAAHAGAKAIFKASFKSRELTVSRAGQEPIVWTSLDPISAVDAVYLSPNGKLVAVEMRTRAGGRVAEQLVVFVVPNAADVRAASAAAAAAAPVPKRTAEIDALIAAGNKALARRKWAAAEASFRKALAAASADPEALYGAAVAAMRSKKKPAALADLDQLATSNHPKAPYYRVKARHDPAFKSLLANKQFRQAVGIDATPGRALSAYERLVGSSAHWEQAGIKCERLRVNLKLDRARQTFTLVLRDSCRGYTDTTKLSGAWKTAGADGLALTFPNPGGKAEVMPCRLRSCTDGSGEDCLVCAAGTDMEMLLRLVRR